MNDYVIRGHAGLPSRMETSPGTPLRTMNPRDVDYVIQMTAPGDRVLFLQRFAEWLIGIAKHGRSKLINPTHMHLVNLTATRSNYGPGGC